MNTSYFGIFEYDSLPDDIQKKILFYMNGPDFQKFLKTHHKLILQNNSDSYKFYLEVINIKIEQEKRRIDTLEELIRIYNVNISILREGGEGSVTDMKNKIIKLEENKTTILKILRNSGVILYRLFLYRYNKLNVKLLPSDQEYIKKLDIYIKPNLPKINLPSLKLNRVSKDKITELGLDPDYFF